MLNLHVWRDLFIYDGVLLAAASTGAWGTSRLFSFRGSDSPVRKSAQSSDVCSSADAYGIVHESWMRCSDWKTINSRINAFELMHQQPHVQAELAKYPSYICKYFKLDCATCRTNLGCLGTIQRTFLLENTIKIFKKMGRLLWCFAAGCVEMRQHFDVVLYTGGEAFPHHVWNHVFQVSGGWSNLNFSR